MKTPTVTLAGQPCVGGSVARWRFREGVLPVIETFEVSRKVAKILQGYTVGTPRGVRLYMEIEGRPPLTVDDLFIIQVGPGVDPYSYKIKVADRRIWWSYAHVERFYNMRRRIGVRRVDQYDRVELTTTPDVFWYAPWTMKNPDAGAAGKWTPHEALEDVLKELQDAERSAGIEPFSFAIKEGAIKKEIPLEGVEISDKGNAALQKLLSYMPVGALRLTASGNVVVYSRADGGDKAVAKKIRPELLGEGHVRMVDNGALRPREVHVLFSAEPELRINYIENRTYKDAFANGTLKSALVPESEIELDMENVLPSPDLSLTLETGEKVAEGTWITVDQAFKAWGPAPRIGKNLDHAIVQRLFNPYFDLWGPLSMLGRLDPFHPWTARIAALQRHYRQTFRINRRIMDRLWRIEGKRFGSIDVVSGQRSCATAYFDRCEVYATPLFVRQHDLGYKPGEATYATNVAGYPGGADGAIDSDTWVGPATVNVVDSDQGIVHLEFKMHPLNLYEKILPGMMDSDTLPSADVAAFARGTSRRPVTFNSRVQNGKFPALVPRFKCAIILTAIPGAPNTDQKLVRVVVRPEDVKDILPDAAAEGVTNAYGPVMEIRIGPGVETARIPWFDGARDRIKSLLGIPEVPDSRPNLDDLIINLDFNSDTGGASLNAIAKAYAARVYAGLCDRMGGQGAGVLAAGTEPAGWVQEVTHAIDPKGPGITIVSLPDKLADMDPRSLMDANTRAHVMRTPPLR
jgi:hypothetical protein